MLNKAKNLFFIIVAVAGFTACGSDDAVKPIIGASNNVNANNAAIPYAQRIEMPSLKGGTSKFLVYTTTPGNGMGNEKVNFCVEWDTSLKSQRWTAYQLTKANSTTGKNPDGSNVSRWYPNQGERQYPYATEHLASSEYYTDQYGQRLNGQSFQHGHICPSADRLYTQAANKQTFYMTNMQPQYGAFNGYSGKNEGLWLRMENQVRKWAKTLAVGDTLYVCKGGTIDNEAHIIGRLGNQQIVPRYFFMAFVMKNTQGYRGIAFWSEQDTQYHMEQSLASKAISIDELEMKTGIDFFCNLPDDIEATVEASHGLKVWGL